MNVMIFWVCVAIGSIVYGILIWSLVAYRKTKKQEASFHKSTATEIAWTVVPLLIIIAMTIPAAKVLTRLYKGDDSETEGRMEIQESLEYQELHVFAEGIESRQIKRLA